MEELPLILVKKIELKLENSIESAKALIEFPLKEYRSEEILFKKKASNWVTEFTIGSNTNQNKLSLTLAPEINNATVMTLEIISINSYSKGETVSQIAKKVDILLEDILFQIMNGLKIKGKAKVIEKGKQCNKCKKINDLDAQFCKICGNKISEVPLSPSKVPKKALIPSKPSEENPTMPEISAIESPPLPKIPKKLLEQSKLPLETPSMPRIPQEPVLESPSIPRIPKKPINPSRPPRETPVIPRIPQKPILEASASFTQPSSDGPYPFNEQPQSTQELIKTLDSKYPHKFECELCEIKCAYKDPFILLLNDVKNLKEPFKKFDEFLRTKELIRFSDFIYDFAQNQLKQYPKFSLNELPDIAFCIFSILSFHILEKADHKIRLTFAEKIKNQLNHRFNKENLSILGKNLVAEDIGAPPPKIKTGLLHIEENRCPFCYKKFDERTIKLKIKGYLLNCPNCDHLL